MRCAPSGAKRRWAWVHGGVLGACTLWPLTGFFKKPLSQRHLALRAVTGRSGNLNRQERANELAHIAHLFQLIELPDGGFGPFGAQDRGHQVARLGIHRLGI